MKCPVCKKSIAHDALKCPYCKTRTGLLCPNCKHVNPVGQLKCSNCGQELLKICKKCNGVNFPTATKCRKCGAVFGEPEKKKKNKTNYDDLKYNPRFYSFKDGINALSDALLDKNKKIISLTGGNGYGKTSVLYSALKKINDRNICMGKCTPLTQLTPGGVVQDMLINLFSLPNFGINNPELKKNANEFFSKEFKFLQPPEVSDLINFIYSFNDGNYEDIIINKKRTYSILNKVFEAFVSSGKFIFVVDNFDFIDGFSAEFLTNLIRKDRNWNNLKFVAVYNEPKPICGFFGTENRNLNSFEDINIRPVTIEEIATDVVIEKDSQGYVTEREKEIILEKANGNLAYIQQAFGYAYDCQINDKTFLLPDDFSQLIKERLATLKNTNKIAYKVLCAAAILGDKINVALLRQIFGFDERAFYDILNYLGMSDFVRKYDEVYYEFNNLLLWETILKNITKDSEFDDINVKIGKAVSMFNLNTNATMAMIAHNLRETRMAFDIWTKTTRLASYIGDINLYVIAQKQCLALLNEFNESETLKIRYSISEKLGKLLSEYDPQEALEFLPDAIASARANNDEVKEIELLGYLALCCSKTGNYFGNVECIDNVLKKLNDGHELERAMIISAKLSALLDIGNCGEVISLADNDVLPILNKYLAKPRLSKLFPLGLLFDTWLKVYLVLATALALQGNERSFAVLKNLFEIIDKHKITDKQLLARAKTVQAYAYTMKGDINTSMKLLHEVDSRYRDSFMDEISISRLNLVYIINKFFTKDYEGLRDELFEAVTFANNSGDNFTKNIIKTLLGKLLKDENKAQQALEIYNEQVSYFAKEKMALGALLSWYLIADATIVTENSKSAIDIASQALEISVNPNIDNYFFAGSLRLVLATAYMNIADYITAKINIEEGLKLAKQCKMYDLLSRLYLLYGKYYYDIGKIATQDQIEYLRGSAVMFEKAMEFVVKETQNSFIKNSITFEKEKLNDFCTDKGFKL